MITIALAMMAAGPSQADLRHSFAECLSQASTKAKSQKIGADGFVAFAKTSCSSAATPFADALASTNVSHGMSRKAAATDAQSQVDDYYDERLENYKVELEPIAPEVPPKSN